MVKKAWKLFVNATAQKMAPNPRIKYIGNMYLIKPHAVG